MDRGDDEKAPFTLRTLNQIRPLYQDLLISVFSKAYLGALAPVFCDTNLLPQIYRRTRVVFAWLMPK
jgi:hypothetical protein